MRTVHPFIIVLGPACSRHRPSPSAGRLHCQDQSARAEENEEEDRRCPPSLPPPWPGTWAITGSPLIFGRWSGLSRDTRGLAAPQAGDPQVSGNASLGFLARADRQASYRKPSKRNPREDFMQKKVRIEVCRETQDQRVSVWSPKGQRSRIRRSSSCTTSRRRAWGWARANSGIFAYQLAPAGASSHFPSAGLGTTPTSKARPDSRSRRWPISPPTATTPWPALPEGRSGPGGGW